MHFLTLYIHNYSIYLQTYVCACAHLDVYLHVHLCICMLCLTLLCHTTPKKHWLTRITIFFTHDSVIQKFGLDWFHMGIFSQCLWESLIWLQSSGDQMGLQGPIWPQRLTVGIDNPAGPCFYMVSHPQKAKPDFFVWWSQDSKWARAEDTKPIEPQTWNSTKGNSAACCWSMLVTKATQMEGMQSRHIFLWEQLQNAVDVFSSGYVCVLINKCVFIQMIESHTTILHHVFA